jgi:hypothetical protein
MKRSLTAWLACVTILGAAAHAQAEGFTDVKYLGGVPGVGPCRGVLIVDGGQLRFEDRKGRTLFTRPLATVTSWVGSEKRTSFGRVLGNIALVPVGVALTGGYGDPWVGGTRKDRPIVMVGNGAGTEAPVRLRTPKNQLRQIVDAINLGASRAASSQPAAASAGTEAAVSPASN